MRKQKHKPERGEGGEVEGRKGVDVFLLGAGRVGCPGVKFVGLRSLEEKKWILLAPACKRYSEAGMARRDKLSRTMEGLAALLRRSLLCPSPGRFFPGSICVKPPRLSGCVAVPPSWN